MSLTAIRPPPAWVCSADTNTLGWGSDLLTCRLSRVQVREMYAPRYNNKSAVSTRRLTSFGRPF